MSRTVSFRLNGKSARLEVEGERPLLWVLRCDLGLSGTKFGCGEGLCGACTVLVNNQAVRSCAVPVKDVNGKNIVTIEGLASGPTLHAIQQAFVEHSAFQCGYCTSGMIMSAYALLLENPHPDDAEIVRRMDDNLCRCGSHTRVVQAIHAAATAMKGVGR